MTLARRPTGAVRRLSMSHLGRAQYSCLRPHQKLGILSRNELFAVQWPEKSFRIFAPTKRESRCKKIIARRHTHCRRRSRAGINIRHDPALWIAHDLETI